jgi:hypothetical protein
MNPDAANPDLPPDLAAEMESADAFYRRLEEALPQPADAALPDDLAAELRLLHAGSGLRQFGRFHILRELGRGGCGIVFLAFDPVLGRRVALKVPRAEALLTPELRGRFLREARLAAGLDHPHVVPVHEAGEVGAVCYIASAYCPGSDLAAWLEKQGGPTEPRQAAQLVATLADAIQHAHDRGVVHRDLKPSNVLLFPTPAAAGEGDGNAAWPETSAAWTPKVTDFGLARLLEREMDKTTTGVIIGSPPYMAPEQAESRLDEIGPAPDIYALGAILYETLTGRAPFWGSTALETLDQVRTSDPTPPRRLRPGLPRSLDVICLKCLQKKPGQRYGSARDLADDLRRFLNDEPIHARPPGLLHRLGLWCRHADRVRDAGLYMMVNGIVMIIFCIIGVVLIEMGAMPVERPGALLVQAGCFIGAIYLPMVWFGWKTRQRKAYAIWTGTVLSFAFVLMYVLKYAFLPSYDSGGLENDSNPQLRLANDLLLFTVFGVQFAVYVVALVAYYSNRTGRRQATASG